VLLDKLNLINEQDNIINKTKNKKEKLSEQDLDNLLTIIKEGKPIPQRLQEAAYKLQEGGFVD
jgi:hypothetical protein